MEILVCARRVPDTSENEIQLNRNGTDIERDELVSSLGIAVLILNQHAADTVSLDHLYQVRIQRRTVKLDNHHLSEFLIQTHALYNLLRQFAIR